MLQRNDASGFLREFWNYEAHFETWFQCEATEIGENG